MYLQRRLPARPRRNSGTWRSTRAVATIACAGAATVGLAACGSSAATSGTRTGSSTQSDGSTATTSGRTTTSGLDLAALGSLTDYAGRMTDNGATISVEVHSPTDWSESTGGFPILHVDGTTYVRTVGPSGRPGWVHSPDTASSYRQSPYPGVATQFADFTKVADATITKGAPCAVAGVAGHTWTIASPHTAVLSEQESACVADGSGALLSLTTGASGSAVPANGFAYSFTVTEVGGVPALAVPSPLLAG